MEKKTQENVIISQMCITNDTHYSHMMYCSWDMECNGQNFLSFWTFFCSFTALITRKIIILKKWKKCLEILSFYTKIPKMTNHIMYGSWDIEGSGQNFLSFWNIFCPFTPLTTWKIKLSKKWKKYLEILSFYTSVP